MSPARRLAVVVGGPLLAVTAVVVAIPLLVVASVSGPPAAVATVSGVPPRVLAAYQAADAWCPGLRWQLLAGIGSVESGHGSSGGASADPENGEVTPLILGPALDGSAGVRALPGGKWVGWFGVAGPWQQAVGPMQFLPPTFTAWAVDADGDGVASPHDIDDAVATAANYLCGGRAGAVTDERAALLRYNRDDDYASRVLAYADQIGSSPGAAITCPIAGPTTFTDTWLAPRPGGRQHQGVDMFAPEGTPVVAPVAGAVELGSNKLGGLVFRLWGDDGNYYYGAHLLAWSDAGGHVAAGTVLGYVGRTGDAVGTPPHLHFEIHPGGSRGAPTNAANPTEVVTAACA